MQQCPVAAKAATVIVAGRWQHKKRKNGDTKPRNGRN
jgi:hypothetical protein